MDHKTFLVLGDTTIDEFISPRVTDLAVRNFGANRYIVLPYGEKIPIDSIEYAAGGNAPNVAVGLSRMGLQCFLCSQIGDDDMSAFIMNTLSNEHVDTSFVTLQGSTLSNHAIVVLYEGERTIFTYHAKRVYHTPQTFPACDYVYITSMGEGYEQFYEDTFAWATAHAVPVIFNPGTIQMHTPRKKLLPFIKSSTILCLNREEAEYFTDISESEKNEKNLLHALHEIGPKSIVITDAERGAWGSDGKMFYHVDAIKTPIIEKTGAGDAFNSGFLASIAHGFSFEQSLVWGICNASSVIGYVGAQKGLLTQEQMESWLKIAEKNNVSAISLP